MHRQLTDHFVVVADVASTWDFFSRPENLLLITPPWLSFRVTTPEPVRIGPDAYLDYTIRWLGVPVRWRTKIVEWSPPRQFIDVQVRGPYALWMHRHTFTPTSDGTECQDHVIYRLPIPLVGRVVHRLVVREQLMEIFSFRRKVIAEHLGWVRAVQGDVEIKAL